MTKELTIGELITSEDYVKLVKQSIDQILEKRVMRPAAPKGMKYKRDWVDEMIDNKQMNVKFFVENIPAIWTKKSTLSSNTRNGIQMICTDCAQIYIAGLEGKEDVVRKANKKTKSKESEKV